jgi:hypothetical protein
VTSFWFAKFGVLARFYRFLMIRNYVDSIPLPKTMPKRPEPGSNVSKQNVTNDELTPSIDPFDIPLLICKFYSPPGFSLLPEV